MLRTSLLIFTLYILNSSFAQTVTGSWYGKADVMLAGNNSNYLTELVIKQKGNEVEGIFGYYFKDAYQSFFVRGTYNKSTREVNIKNLPMLFYGGKTKNGIECPMHFEGKLMVSALSSSMRGIFYTDNKYKYTCPELRVTLLMDAGEKNQDSLLRNGNIGKKFWQPGSEDFVIAAKPAPDTTVHASSTDTVPTALATTSTAAAPSPGMGIVPGPIPTETAKVLVTKFENRKNTYDKDLLVGSDSVLVTFYDNGDVDGDTISVFLNKKPVLTKQGLTSRGLNIFVALDSLVDINELSMFAENLGKFPPNTALMVISDGTYKYEMYLSASLTQNASVRLKRTPDAEERRRRRKENAALNR